LKKEGGNLLRGIPSRPRAGILPRGLRSTSLCRRRHIEAGRGASQPLVACHWPWRLRCHRFCLIVAGSKPAAAKAVSHDPKSLPAGLLMQFGETSLALSGSPASALRRISWSSVSRVQGLRKRRMAAGSNPAASKALSQLPNSATPARETEFLPTAAWLTAPPRAQIDWIVWMTSSFVHLGTRLVQRAGSIPAAFRAAAQEPNQCLAAAAKPESSLATSAA